MTSSLISGSEFRSIFWFSLPLIFGAVIQQLYTVTDSLIVGKVIGTDALAAVGATGACIFFLLSVNSGLSSACSVIISQYYGAGRQKMVRVSFVSTIYYTLVCSLVLSLAGTLCVDPLLRILLTPEDIFAQASLYLKIYMGGCLGLVLYNNIAAVVRALGDSRTPLLFLILSSLLNIGLDILLVAVFPMGIAGAAIATVLAQTISGLLCLCYALKKFPVFRVRWPDIRPSLKNIGAIASIGIPMGLQSSVLAVGDMIVTGIINSYGTIVVTAYTAANRIHQFVVIPFLQFAIAFCTFTAQNAGAGQLQRIRRGMRRSALFAAAAALAFGLMITMFRNPLIKLFLPEDDSRLDVIVAVASDFLGYVPLLYPFIALIWLYNYMLRGVGAVAVPILSGAIELISKIVLPYFLGKMFGYAGVWYGYPLCWILGWIPSAVYYHSGRWTAKCAGVMERALFP